MDFFIFPAVIELIISEVVIERSFVGSKDSKSDDLTPLCVT